MPPRLRALLFVLRRLRGWWGTAVVLRRTEGTHIEARTADSPLAAMGPRMP